MGIQINGNTDIISAADGSLTIEGTTNFSALQVNSQNLPNAGPLSNRNLIINGAMRIAQRATQVTSVTTPGYRTCDRFYFSVGNLGTWTADQSTDAPEGFSNSYKLTCTTADASPASTDIVYFIQNIEAQNLQHLKFGTANALPLVVSFWVKSNKTGAASFDIYQPDASDRMFSQSYTINAANTWEYKTISIPGDTSGQFDNDNGIGFTVGWWLNSGADFTGGSHQTSWGTLTAINRNVSNLGVGGAISDYFAITGVQLEVGTVATPFEHRSFGDELARCQRYYQKTYNYSDAPGTSTLESMVEGNTINAVFTRITWHFSTPMRAQPNCNIYSTSGAIDKFRDLDGSADVTGDIIFAGENRAGLRCTNTVLTNGRHVGAHATADAEL